jgi:hypothetical protein
MVGAIFIKIKMYNKDKKSKHILNCGVIAISYLMVILFFIRYLSVL